MKIGALFITTAIVAVGCGIAIAQPAATYDPSRIPEIHGTTAQYSLTPRGDVDGIILQDGTQVHLPPHLGQQLVSAIKPGDAVEVRGLKAQALPVVQAVSVKSETSGNTVIDNGPPAQPPTPLISTSQWMTVQGTVREPLYGPLGDINGVLLADGAQIHLPPDQAARLSQMLRAGAPIVAEGYGIAGPYGQSLEARRLGASVAQLTEIGPPVPPPPGVAPPPPTGVAPPVPGPVPNPPAP